jgi:hypothetical protein
MTKTLTISYEIGEESVSYNFKVTSYLFHEDEIVSNYNHEGLLSVDSEVFKSVLKELTGKNLILEKLEQPGEFLVFSPVGLWFKGKDVDFSNLEGIKNYIVDIANTVNKYNSLKGFSDSITFTI